MHSSPMHYFPLAWPFLVVLVFFLLLAFVLIELRILRTVYEQIGIQRRYVYAVLVLTLLGSYVNIPVAQLPPEEVQSDQIVTVAGVQYVIPHVEHWRGTIIAVNVGGALVPTILSFYLLAKFQLYVRGLLGVAIVAAVVHGLAQPVAGLGIQVPIFVPPILAACVAMLLSWRHAAPLAYVAGSLGTLIGADLLNLGRIQGLGAPIASIGGAGTFDGVFLTGILAVLLTPFSKQAEPLATEANEEIADSKKPP
jgi:uncharacterized membrane protein